MFKILIVSGCFAVSFQTKGGDKSPGLTNVTDDSKVAECSKSSIAIHDLLVRQKTQSGLKTDTEYTEQLTEFSELPAEMDGCSCNFSLSKAAYHKGRYIYVNDYANTSFVFINHKLQKFTLINHNPETNTFLYHGNVYTLKIVVTKEVQSGNEERLVQGVATLFKAKRLMAKKIFVGYCGC